MRDYSAQTMDFKNDSLLSFSAPSQLDVGFTTGGESEITTELPKPVKRSYPAQYVKLWKMKNGESVTIRPIRQDDEVGADDPVAGNDDRNRVGRIGPADGACRSRLAEPFRQLTIAPGLAEWDLEEALPDTLLEFGSVEIDLEIEGAPLTAEVLLDLIDDMPAACGIADDRSPESRFEGRHPSFLREQQFDEPVELHRVLER